MKQRQERAASKQPEAGRQAAGKKRYASPRLVAYGSLTKLTQTSGRSGGGTDSSMTMVCI